VTATPPDPEEPAGLFGDALPAPTKKLPLDAAVQSEDVIEVGARLPQDLYLGTSSWSFPGWAGLVYGSGASESVLSRKGLAAYSRHPVLRAAGIDRGFYSALTRAEFAAYAQQVPASFRFLVKAPSVVTDASVRDENGRVTGENEGFLDARLACELFVEPATTGLEANAGPLVFQFSPLPRKLLAEPQRFADALHGFLKFLPKGPLYAVEIRDAEVLTEGLMQALSDSNARYCFGVHPRLPGLPAQAKLASMLPPGPTVARWNLHAGYRYEEAKANYAPFNRLVDPDPRTRKHLAQLAMRALVIHQPAFIVANNKAEGSAPLSCVELAREVETLVEEKRAGGAPL